MRELTAEQGRAVERRDGSLLVRAGAGTGKTTVLVERFVRAVTEDGVEVDRILAITFTEKAAAEMKSRVRARFLERGANLLLRQADQLGHPVGARLYGPGHRHRVDRAGNRHDGGVGTHGRPPI